MQLPYGSWPSPVSTDLVTAGTIGLGGPQLDHGTAYWSQSRPDENGRISIWRRTADGAVSEVTPAPAYVRSTVHEYGGGAWHVGAGTVVWSSFPDGAIWVRRGDDEPYRLTGTAGVRYGDLRVHPDRGLVLAVREDHRGDGEPVNDLVALRLSGGAAVQLQAGADFYSTPELSADGRLAWVEWNHPDMPWDATRLLVAPLVDRDQTIALGPADLVAGRTAESAIAPRWLPGGGLIFCSDRSDWWNFYRWDGERSRPLHPRNVEFCPPPWVLGQRPYAVVDDDRLLCSGGGQLGVLHLDSGELTPIEAPGSSWAGLDADRDAVLLLADSPSAPARVALGGFGGGNWTTLRSASDARLEVVALPEPVRWSGPAGQVHGWYYPPTHAECNAPTGKLPPLITTIHGGPTSEAQTGFDPSLQYWTSRGIAVLSVNYSGSTGHGRAYRNRLHGRWGELDVADCTAGARAMAEQGRADPARLAIMGGSAGGYTVLRALTTSPDFAAGISLYGVGDLSALATDTHKFESRYLDRLIGPYPEAADVYAARSPIRHLDDLASPILLLQGGQDKVVPPDQAESFAEAARAKGLPVALIMFPDEAHGFRRADSIAATLESTLVFLGRIFGFQPAGALPDLRIENLAEDATS